MSHLSSDVSLFSAEGFQINELTFLYTCIFIYIWLVSVSWRTCKLFSSS
jgi:hypothetical protein